MNNNNIMNNLYMNDNMNYMNIINRNNMSMNFSINNSEYITIFFSYDTIISIKANIKEKISKLIERYKNTANIFEQNLEFFFNDKVLNPNISIEEAGIYDKSTIFVRSLKVKIVYNSRIIKECNRDSMLLPLEEKV